MPAESFSATSHTFGSARLGTSPSARRSAPRPQTDDDHIADDPPPQTAPDTPEGPSRRPVAAADDAVQELIRVAVVSRPLDDVVDLVTRLEQSPDSLSTAASVLRLAAVARSVDDVSRLVELLGPPEHPVEHMDDAIRYAAANRPVPEVSRLVHLLSRPPHDPHTGVEAVHAAATSRSVEDLTQLIGRMGDHQDAGTPEARPAKAPTADRAEAPAPGPVTGADADVRARHPGNGVAPLGWLRRAAGVLMLLCAAAHFPWQWPVSPTPGSWVALGVFLVCALTGVALCWSRSPAAAVAGTLAAGALALCHLVAERASFGTLTHVLHPGGVTPPLPALTASVAALASLLVVALTVAGLRSAATTPHDGPRRQEAGTPR